MNEMYFAQTHVIPPEGLSWYNGTVRLTLVGKREALFMFKLDDNIDGSMFTHMFGYDASGQYVGAVPISPPNQLPPVESNQTNMTFSTEHYSATLPGAWIVPYFGLAIGTQSTPAACCTTNRTIFSEVSSDNEVDIYTLPTYLYGANETNSAPLAQTMGLPLKNQQELWAKQPVSKFNFRPHPAGMLKFDWMVAGPTSTKPARLLTDRSQEEDGFYTMGLVLGLLGTFRGVNGHSNSQYYSAMQTLQNGNPVGAGGGLGGGSRATGDAAWSGIFIHEVGHGFGLPHAGGAYPNSYPYEQGSLSGSKWGYDSNRKIFLPNTIPPSASSYKNCKSGRLLTSEGLCVKQDYMQGGAGDQAKGDIFTMASDYNAAKIQRYADTVVFPDSKSSTGYSMWNTTGKYRIEAKPTMQDNGLYGLTGGIPEKTGVMVYTVIAPYSLTTPEVNRFYPINNAYRGNLMHYIDPTNVTSLDELRKAVWYCRPSGCDYTLRMTYVDGSVIHQLHQGGFRGWFNNAINSGAADPLSSDSFITFTMNFPGDKKAKMVQLLDTPVVLTNGVPALPTVLMTYTYP
ncbi:hypothetical protein BASA81_006490 [Batrachochytrium salamandrivorans]|nr:hypothetical protein BASA81_006490 [Batrachochytrium salamandrivorans]